MGILGGIVDVAKNLGSAALAPAKGVLSMAATSLETTGAVAGNLLTLQPGKALDSLADGIKEQADNVVGIPRDQWNGLKGAAGGLGETLISGVKFAGEPIRGAGRVAANNLETVGGAAGQALNGNFGGAGSVLAGGLAENFSIAGETFHNQINNAF